MRIAGIAVGHAAHMALSIDFTPQKALRSVKGVFRAPERQESSLTKGHPELHFLSQGHSEGFEQALPGYYSIADTNECQPAAAAATTDKERLRRLPEPL